VGQTTRSGEALEQARRTVESVDGFLMSWFLQPLSTATISSDPAYAHPTSISRLIEAI
jgi:hypothetical protein